MEASDDKMSIEYLMNPETFEQPEDLYLFPECWIISCSVPDLRPEVGLYRPTEASKKCADRQVRWCECPIFPQKPMKRMTRMHMTREKRLTLEAWYQDNPSPSTTDKKVLAKLLHEDLKRVHTW